MAASGARPDRAAFRHAPPDLPAGLVVRGRLVAALRDRFDRRLTVVTAGAGFGKTTLLAQAVAENTLERAGVDVWLRVTEADEEADVFLAGLASSLGGGDPGATVGVEDIVDAVWSRTPTAVALVLDDTHRLGPASWTVLRRLVDELPTNGHIVVSGRTPPALPVARLRAHGQAEVVDEADLAFTDDELSAFGAARGLDPDLVAHLPPWPALAVLQSAAGRAASAAFVAEEVLAALPADQVRLLALTADLGAIDDPVVAALAPGSGWTAADVVRGVPLVQSDGAGAHRLHALLADVARRRIDARDRAGALGRAAALLLAEGADRQAVDAAAVAGDRATLHRAVCRFARRPIRSISVPDVVALLERLPEDLQPRPLGTFLRAARQWEGSATRAAQLFGEAEEQARVEGDVEVEVLCRWRLVQLHYLDDHSRLVVTPRDEELAARGVPLAASIPAFVRSVEAQQRGDPAAAVAALDALDPSDPEQRAESTAMRLVDLGRPEAVPATTPDPRPTAGIDLFATLALWLRGDIAPEDAWAIARTLPGVAGRRGVQHEQLSIRALVALSALAVGEVDEARALLDRCRGAIDLVGAHARLHVTLGDAMVALQTEGEEEAAARLRRSLAEVPLDAWPVRAHLFVLAPLRALVPERAGLLDHLDLGPSLRATVAAGRALVELRHGDPAPAAALPWTTPEVLRCHVPPPLLAELALAASPGDVAARQVLERVPRLRRWLQRIADRPGPLRDAAAARLEHLPARPPYDVSVTALGGLRITRDDGGPVDPARTSRVRVRQLLAALVLEPRVARADLAARLWPDLPPEKAAANLRANLRHLQAAFQPDRPAAEPPWFVQADGDTIALAPEGIAVDVHRFDQHVRQAVEAEASGLPSVALEEYRAAAELDRGPLLPGLHDDEVEVERARLRTVAYAVRCRLGELVLARGEPEDALRQAAAAVRIDSWSERAHRLCIRAHLALGSTTAARSAGSALARSLAEHGLAPEPETLALLRRIDVPA